MPERFTGLTAAEAVARFKSEGPNELPRAKRRMWWRVVIDVLHEPMFALLIAGGIIYAALGDLHEALVLLIFATLSVSIAVIQDFRSERVLEALRTLASPRALVIRDGARVRIPGTHVVRGDMIIVGEGDRVAADAVVRATTDLRVDESALTGESVSVSKRPTTDIGQPGRPGGDATPHIFAGTLIVGGSGLAEVIATGQRSQIGVIGLSLNSIQSDRPRTEKAMRRLVRIWAVLGMAASVGAAALYILTRGGWMEGLLAGIALGMTMLPEEFPLILSVFMVMGAWRISKARVLTRRASAIEYLGSASVLCTDKTGTLTRNQMRVAALATSNDLLITEAQSEPGEDLAEIARIGALACPPTSVDPMERAIQDTVARAPEPDATLIKTYGLRPSLMAMSQVWRRVDGNCFIAAKGAVEAVAQLCRLEPDAMLAIRRQTDQLARQGMRVIAVAKAALAAGDALPQDHRDIRFELVGLIGLSDPLRAEVPAAIAECRSAGIRVIMITGDYPATAEAIARQAGIEGSATLTGSALESMNDEQLQAALKTVNVCARITPLQKLRIVNALKANGDVVAMTGDGVNDAPSLKAADIGIAMGGRGTDVAREAAAIVLLDDDFTSIVRTIRLGRRIYDNLRKAISFVIAVHILIAGLALTPLAFGLPLLLFPIHIAFLEMIIDPVCSLAFEAEREESDVMRRPPRSVNQPLLTPGMVIWAVVQGVIGLGLVMCGYLMALGSGMTEQEARTFTFVALVGVNIVLTLINRSFHRRSLIAMLMRDNRVLWIVLGMVAAVLAIVLSWAPLRGLFRFGPLQTEYLLLAVGLALMALMALNMAKHWAPLAGEART